MDVITRTPALPDTGARGLDAHLDAHCVWIVSPLGYPHAAAFDEVAVALSEGIAALGGSAPIVRDRADWAGRAPIVLGANLLAATGSTSLPPDAIVYNLEQVDAASSWFDDTYLDLLGRSAVVDYSERNRALLARWGIDAGILELGWSPGLEQVPARRTEHVDVCFYGSINPRRAALLDELDRRGLVVERLFGVYGATRDAAIARAKVVLNAHFYESSVFEIVRVSYLLANGVCVVTEGDPGDPEIAPFLDGLAVAAYDELADRVESLVHDPEARRRQADAGLAAIRERPQSAAWRRLFEPDPSPGHTSTATTTRTPSAMPRPGLRGPGLRGPGLRGPGLRGISTVTLLSPSDAPRTTQPVRRLADAFAANGVRAEIVSIGPGSTVRRDGLVCHITGVDAGSTGSPVEIRHRDDHLLVIPDVLAADAGSMLPFRTAVWWLGVDDVVGAGSPIADPERLDRLLGAGDLVHLHRGAYTREFLRSRGIAALAVGDHLDLPLDHDRPDEPDPGLVVAVGPDGPAAAAFAEAGGRLSVVPVPDDPAIAADVLASAVCYVHVGGLPGCHHLPRLAAALGAVVFVPNAGAGRYHEDFPFADTFRFEPDDLVSGALARRVRAVVAAPHRPWDDQRAFRDRLGDERSTLHRDIGRLVSP